MMIGKTFGITPAAVKEWPISDIHLYFSMIMLQQQHEAQQNAF